MARRDTRTAAADPAQPWLELDVTEAPHAKAEASWNEHVGSLEVAVAKGITPFLAGAVIKAVLGALPLPWIWRRVAPLRAA